jgi:hypothetical protein
MPSAFGPKRLETVMDSGEVVITVIPPAWTSFKATNITLNPDQFRRYKEWLATSELIQNKLPELTNAEREVLLSGISEDQWDREFGEND